MRVLLLILITLCLAGCGKIEHHHTHEHHYDKLFPPKKSKPAEPGKRVASDAAK